MFEPHIAPRPLPAPEPELQVNLWEQKAKEAKALRNYAAAKNKWVNSVTVDEIEQDGGLDHWANLTVTFATPAPVRASKTGHVQNTPTQRKEPKGKDPVATSEKNAKFMLGKLQGSQALVQQWVSKYEADKENMSWAGPLLQLADAAAARIQAADQVSGDFAAEFKAAQFEKDSMKALRKGYGEKYGATLQAWVASCQAAIDEYVSVVERIQKMGRADHYPLEGYRSIKVFVTSTPRPSRCSGVSVCFLLCCPDSRGIKCANLVN